MMVGVAFITGLIAAVLVVSALLFMLVQTYAAISAMAYLAYHEDFLQVISGLMGTAIAPLAVAAILFVLTKRKQMAMVLFVCVAFGILTVLYVNVLAAPAYASIQSDISVQQTFKIIMAVLELVTLVPLLAFSFIEMSKLRAATAKKPGKKASSASP
jgi:uncharacterized membrane protein